jgi:hypothetical protein
MPGYIPRGLLDAAHPDDSDPTYRMSMLPFGTYADPQGGGEHLGFAVPGMVQEPINALSRLMGTPSNPGTFTHGPDYPGNADNMRTLMETFFGGNATRGAGAAESLAAHALSDQNPSLLGAAVAGAEKPGQLPNQTLYHGSKGAPNFTGPTWLAEDPDYAANFPLYNGGETSIAPVQVRSHGTPLDLTRYPADHGFTVEDFKRATGINGNHVDDDLKGLIGDFDPTFEAFQALDLPSVADQLAQRYPSVRANQYVEGGGEGISHLVFNPSDILTLADVRKLYGPP